MNFKNLSDHYVNIVKRSCGRKLTSIAIEHEIVNNKTVIRVSFEWFENHECVKVLQALEENSIEKSSQLETTIFHRFLLMK